MDWKVAIGTDDFAEVRKDYYFADKTNFISEFFSSHSKVTLITRPRRFGKSLLLSMMQRFLDIRNAKENRKLFDGLRVSHDARAMAEQGKRPVVFVTLKDWASGLSWEAMQERITLGVSEMVAPFRFLMDSDAVDEADKKALSLLRSCEGNITRVRSAMALLSKMLHDHYGKPVVLLIDEYDAPIQYAWANGYYRDAIDFFRNFFSAAFKSNPYLDFAILTGVLRIAKESIFSGLNNVEVSSVLSGGYPDACGYTKEEVAEMARAFGCEDKLSELAEWYDGYSFDGVDIYNPWSVNNYIKRKCDADAYWVNTSSNSIFPVILSQADEMRWEELRSLLFGGTVTIALREGIIYDEIGRNSNDIYSLLLQTGYLKSVNAIHLRSGGYLYELAIPNKEIRLLYQTEILNRVDRSYGEVSFYKMGLAMERGDAKEFQKQLQGILVRAVSAHDAAQPESFYHGLMLGCALFYEADYRVESNQESGYGRFDLAMFPKAQKLPGVLMEFKSVKEEAELEAAATAACEQMQEKAYAMRLRTEGVTTIWQYGIAFCKKHALVKMM